VTYILNTVYCILYVLLVNETRICVTCSKECGSHWCRICKKPCHAVICGKTDEEFGKAVLCNGCSASSEKIRTKVTLNSAKLNAM
jgi:hypothetical protein